MRVEEAIADIRSAIRVLIFRIEVIEKELKRMKDSTNAE